MMKLFVGYRVASYRSPALQNKTPYGSWKDIKYYIHYIRYCPDVIITLINTQISEDLVNMEYGLPCSLAAKWIPREASKKFGWITILFAKDYYKQYGYSGWSKSAMRKSQTHYLQTISKLNKYIDMLSKPSINAKSVRKRTGSARNRTWEYHIGKMIRMVKSE